MKSDPDAGFIKLDFQDVEIKRPKINKHLFPVISSQKTKQISKSYNFKEKIEKNYLIKISDEEMAHDFKLLKKNSAQIKNTFLEVNVSQSSTRPGSIPDPKLFSQKKDD